MRRTGPTTFFDVTDLLLYLKRATTVSGIQRVQCEIMQNSLEVDGAGDVRFLALDQDGRLCAIETSALMDVIGYLRSTTVTRTGLDRRLEAIHRAAEPPAIRRGDTLLTIGAFWQVAGAGTLLQTMKNAGVIVGVFVHDILSITDPEYFPLAATQQFIKVFVEATTYADFIVTTSQYNKAALIRYLHGRQSRPLPIDVVPLGHKLSNSQSEPDISRAVADIANSEFVLCVGTIEVRKNPTYLFHVWKMMIRSGRRDVPTLVFVGRSGWLVQDFIEQLKASDHLGGKIVFLHNVTDVELTVLYQRCILTIFPSFVEGWGLPVGEGLAHGKICIASNTGAIPEVAGELADYIDPYNVSDGLKVLSRYLDDPGLRRRREDEIARRFKPRPWRTVAEDFLKSVQAQASQVSPFEGMAAIKLPPNRFLPITRDGSAILQRPIEGDLSAELICISGWRLPELGGVWARDPTATIRFRADAPAGTAINLIMRLRAATSDIHRARITSGSGSVKDVSLNDSSDCLAVLPCEVELDSLVSVIISFEGTPREIGTPYGCLRGILYLQSQGHAAVGGNKLGNGGMYSAAVRSTGPDSTARPKPSERLKSRGRVEAALGTIDESRRASSFEAFLHSTDSSWPSQFTDHRDAPIFANFDDKQIFFNSKGVFTGPITDQIRLVRSSGQYVSTLRFSEGSIFDASGTTSRGHGYLKYAPTAAWLSRDDDGTWIDEEAIAAAPNFDGSYFIFYNGNLHNYYHWMVEGLLPLNVLTQALGREANVQIVLPRSMDINAVFDHRGSLSAVGLDRYGIAEVAATLIKVQEAVWMGSDSIQLMPAHCVQEFQKRVAALHTRSRLKRKRRLLVARKGPTRMIENFRQVSSSLSRLGFETVYLEGMSVVDQIVLFQNAEFIISPHGAGLANLLFCDPGTKVIEFMPLAEMRPFFWLISDKLGLIHGMQFCPTVKTKDYQGFQGSVQVDIDKLEALYRMVDAHQ